MSDDTLLQVIFWWALILLYKDDYGVEEDEEISNFDQALPLHYHCILLIIIVCQL